MHVRTHINRSYPCQYAQKPLHRIHLNHGTKVETLRIDRRMMDRKNEGNESTRAYQMVRAAFIFGIYDYSTNDVECFGSQACLFSLKSFYIFIFLYIYSMPVSYVILKSPKMCSENIAHCCCCNGSMNNSANI